MGLFKKKEEKIEDKKNQPINNNSSNNHGSSNNDGLINYDDNSNKNKKLTGSNIRIKVNRLLNGTPAEIAVFDGSLIRDGNNNTIIFNEKMNFKEEMPGMQDSLISDILYKLKSRTSSKKGQLDMINKFIKEQEDIITNEKNGFIIQKVKEVDKSSGKKVFVEKKIKINRQTEQAKLRILKCSRYALDNKQGNGSFESIDINGNRTLTYALIDGELIPYWFKHPSDSGELMMLVPDVVARKKFYKEAETEAIQDFNESVDWYWKGILGVAMKFLTVAFFITLIVWTIFLARWSADLHNEDLVPMIQKLELENQKIQQRCSNQLAQQMENNDVLINYAKNKMQEETSNNIPDNIDKSNIKI